MNKLTTQVGGLGIVAMLCLALSPNAQAATDWTNSWNYSSCGGQTNAGQWGNAYTCTGANANMNLSAWSADLNPIANFQTASVRDYGSSAGYGIASREECGNSATPCDPGTGPHSADNKANLDGFLLKFSSANQAVGVALNTITMGWNGTDNATSSYNDSDISVYYYTGNVAPDLTTSNSTNLLSTGWALLGNYANVGSNAQNTATFGNTGDTAKTSSWWLVTASNTNTSTTSYDAFKLLGAGGSKISTPSSDNQVPEPATFALLAVAGLGAVGARRRLGKRD